ncbi:COG4315 family predicted lipoprotein [Oceanicola sp. S124]|uniref:COG4315 family predicted lipoprotein n=1 Tax=Oceanicola sp. S124 TaxID=1042378 RepID=UPI000255A68E|nr:hypothetical protein [Oceanicola sp. S124]
MKFALLAAAALVAGTSGAVWSAGYGQPNAHAGYGTHALTYTPQALEPLKVSGPAILVDDKGMTLYTFDIDQGGASKCYDGCAVDWPPYLAGADASASGDFSTVARTDGTSQWAYKGAPLYYWIGDAEPGDTNGDGIGGVWHVAVK